MAGKSRRTIENPGPIVDPSTYIKADALTLDWIAGIIPRSDVAAVLEELGEITKGLLASHRWAVAQGGFFNYGTRLCWQGRFNFSLCWNEVVSARGTDEFDQLLPELDRRKAIRAAQREAAEAAEAGVPTEVVADSYTMRQVCGGRKVVHMTAQEDGNNPYIYIQITGAGCAALREYSCLQKLVFWLGQERFRCSRLDVACDIFDRGNPIVPLIEAAFRGSFAPEVGGYCLKAPTTPTKCIQLVQVGDPENGLTTNCIYGNHGSNSGMFRAYNKYHEQRYKSGVLTPERLQWLSQRTYWYRLEYEAHSEFAAKCFDYMTETVQALPLVFAAMAGRLFTPIFCGNPGESHARMEVSKVWDTFIGWMLRQNDYFVSFYSETDKDRNRKKALSSYGVFCRNMRKTFVVLLMQLVADSEKDPAAYLNAGVERADGDAWTTDNFGFVPPQLLTEFLRFAAEYKQKYGEKLPENVI